MRTSKTEEQRLNDCTRFLEFLATKKTVKNIKKIAWQYDIKVSVIVGILKSLNYIAPHIGHGVYKVLIYGNKVETIHARHILEKIIIYTRSKSKSPGEYHHSAIIDIEPAGNNIKKNATNQITIKREDISEFLRICGFTDFINIEMAGGCAMIENQ